MIIPATMTIEQAARLMQSFARPWWFAGGWATELFVGRRLREHDDLEIGVLRDDQNALRAHLRDWTWSKAVTIDGVGQWVPWADGERVELPLFQLKANLDGAAPAEVEFMLNDVRNGHLLCRRHASIALPLEQAIGRTVDGLPYLAPEMQLLYKAKHHRDKDESDFAAAIQLMSQAQRRWLKDSLRIWDAADPWIERL